MKSLTHKLLALTFAIVFTTGCASSVTDANLSQADKPQTEKVTADQAEKAESGSESGMVPIYDKPE